MLLKTIETIKLLLENAVVYERKNYDDLKAEYKKKYGDSWLNQTTHIEDDRLYDLEKKCCEIENIYDDFIYHDWH